MYKGSTNELVEITVLPPGKAAIRPLGTILQETEEDRDRAQAHMFFNLTAIGGVDRYLLMLFHFSYLEIFFCVFLAENNLVKALIPFIGVREIH